MDGELDLEIDGELDLEIEGDLELGADLGEGDELGLNDELFSDATSESSSLIDLGQANIPVEVTADIPSHSAQELTHEENIERQIEEDAKESTSGDFHLEGEDDGIEYDEIDEYDDEYDDEEDEYEDGEGTLADKVHEFFAGFKKNANNESSLMEKATQIFKVEGGLTGLISKNKMKSHGGTISKVLSEKVPGLEKFFKKKNDSKDHSPTYEEVTNIDDDNIQIDGDKTVDIVLGGKPKRKVIITRKGVLMLIGVPIILWALLSEDEIVSEPPVKNPVVEEKKPVNEKSPTPDPATVSETPSESETPTESEAPTESEVATVSETEPEVKQPVKVEEEILVENEVPVETPKEETELENEVSNPDTEINETLNEVAEEFTGEVENELPPLEIPVISPSENLDETSTSVGEVETEGTRESGIFEGNSEQVLPQEIIEPEASNEITNQLLEDLEVKLKEERKEQELLEDIKPTGAPAYDNIGKGLVYNCVGQHWACVNEESYQQCRGNFSWNKQQGAEVECYPQGKLESELDCSIIQQEKIDRISETDFCI